MLDSLSPEDVIDTLPWLGDVSPGQRDLGADTTRDVNELRRLPLEPLWTGTQQNSVFNIFLPLSNSNVLTQRVPLL